MLDESLSLFTDFGEIGLDAVIKDPTLKEIPVIGSVLNLIKLSMSIQDRVFINKLQSFIHNVERNSKWKEKFSDEKECKKISKQLIYIIDSSDDDEKLNAIGILFNHFVNGEISKDVYFYLCDIIKKSYWPFLKEIYKIKEDRISNDGKQYNKEQINHLYSLNLFDYSGMTMPIIDTDNNIITKQGSIILVINTYGNSIRQLSKIIHENQNLPIIVKSNSTNQYSPLKNNILFNGEFWIN